MGQTDLTSPLWGEGVSDPVDAFLRRRHKEEDRRKERSHTDAMDEVFDRRTLLAVGRFITRGLMTEVDFSISTGKVANVFRVSSKDGYRALKVYRVGNAVFRGLPPYLLHELREEVGSNSFARLVFAWVRREYMALKACREAEVPVPEPYDYHRNVFLMEFMGEGGLPFPPLFRCEVEDPERLLNDLTRAVRNMVTRAGLVHGDLSPYNVLYFAGRIALIDLGEVVAREHPMARELLLRDAENFTKYFNRQGVKLTTQEMFDRMGGTEL